MGDGLLIEFPNARDAVECAVDLQRSVQAFNEQEGVRPLRIRAGIHLGDVEARGPDILGDAVNIASRIEPLAEAGGVCLTAQVYDQVHNKVSFQFEGLGLKSIKGVPEGIKVYRVVLPWAAGTRPANVPVLPRLAVLPLANISPDPKDEYFADGLTDELISVLSRLRGLRVIARTSVAQYKATTKSARRIGSEQGVSAVLEGSVRKAGDRVRITLQLIDVESEEPRWSQTFERTLDRLFAVQTEVAERTAESLRVELLHDVRAAIERAPTSNPGAHDQFLRGLVASRNVAIGSQEAALGHFEAAIQADPKFALAYAYLANTLLAVAGEYIPEHIALPRAQECVALALKLDPDLSEAHTANGCLAQEAHQNWVVAEAEFRQALFLNPSDSVARWRYAVLLIALQRFEEAREQLTLGLEVDPSFPLLHLWLVAAYHHSGDFGTATALAKRTLELFPHEEWTHLWLAIDHARAGRFDDASKEVDLVPGISGAPSYHRACLLVRLGREREALAILRHWEDASQSAYVPPVWRAAVHASLGDHEAALALLSEGSDPAERALWNDYLWEPFDSLREDHRFRRLLRDQGLPTGLPPRIMAERSLVRPAPSQGTRQAQNPSQPFT